MARKVARTGRPAAELGPAGEVVELELTGMAPTGEAIGRHAGMVVFVPYGLPGEQVHVRLKVRKRSFARGEIVALVQASPARLAPPCPYFGRCGGCDWQHAAYPAQLEYKTGIVREQMARIGKLPHVDVRNCVASPAPYQYRNHTRLVVDRDGHLGYRAGGSHDVVSITACPVLEAAVEAELQHLAPGSSAVTAWQPGDEVELSAWEEHIRVAEYDYHVSPGAFFQANTAIAEGMVAEVLAAAALTGRERVLDLYCGVGLFTLPLGARAAVLAGVEGNPVAAADARINLAAAGMRGEILVQDVGMALSERAICEAAWDVVVLDPPRAGVAPDALARLAGLAAPKVIYVSCDSATLARDARLLCDAGYGVTYVQPFDMFPQTRHVECVALFTL